jgi:hypothetical protein
MMKMMKKKKKKKKIDYFLSSFVFSRIDAIICLSSSMSTSPGLTGPGSHFFQVNVLCFFTLCRDPQCLGFFFLEFAILL